jgi:hypothetical protein
VTSAENQGDIHQCAMLLLKELILSLHDRTMDATALNRGQLRSVELTI